jgi:hypothetical protein
MGLFDSIKNAIFGHSAAAAPTQPTVVSSPGAGASPAATRPASATAALSAGQAPAQAPPPAGQPPVVDVEAILNGLAAKNPQKLNWQSSIVDLMKLLGLDPSLQNRTQLAKELGYGGDAADSAAMNIWLHRQVMRKLAESGGKVPASLQ